MEVIIIKIKIMQENIKEKIIPEDKKQKYMTLASFWVFGLVIAICIWLFISNKMIEWNIESTKKSVSEYEKNIETLKNDKYVIAYSIINQTKDSINKEIEKSQVSKYLKEFDTIGNKFTFLTMQWFSYADGKISTTASVEWKDKDAAFFIADFIKYFREENTSQFKIDTINWVTWNEKNRIFTPLQFNVKE